MSDTVTGYCLHGGTFIKGVRERAMCTSIAAREAVVSKTQFVWKGSTRLSSVLRHYVKQGLPKHHKVVDLIAEEQAQERVAEEEGAKKTQKMNDWNSKSSSDKKEREQKKKTNKRLTTCKTMEEREKKRRRRQTPPRKSQQGKAQAAIRRRRLKQAERGCSSRPHLQYKPGGATAVPLPERYRLAPLTAALAQGSSRVAVPGRCMGPPSQRS